MKVIMARFSIKMHRFSLYKMIILVLLLGISFMVKPQLAFAGVPDGTACTITEVSGPLNVPGSNGTTLDNNCCFYGSCQAYNGPYACGSTVQCAAKGVDQCHVICDPPPLVPCADPGYVKGNQALCSCEYYQPDPNNAETGIYNGNTYTAFGCFPGDIGGFVNIILSIVIGLGLVISLVIMMIGGYKIMTNPGEPETIGEGKTLITNAIIGILVIIFAVIICKIIGINILGINALTGLIS